MMGLIKKISNAFRRRLDPTLRLMVEIGYLSNDLERTRDGVHTFLNFLEEKYSKEFVSYLEARLAEIKKEEKEEKDKE